GGAGDWAPAGPWPRNSNRSSRNRRPSTSACGSHRPWVVPIELPRATTGAPSGPVKVAVSCSDIEEHRFTVALQPDVEPQYGAGPSRVGGVGEPRRQTRPAPDRRRWPPARRG